MARAKALRTERTGDRPAEHAAVEDGAGRPPGSSASLSAKLDYLFRTIRPPDWPKYLDDEVVAAIRARGGPPISATYLCQLRTGARDNPSLKLLQALADFFGVPPAYFVDDGTAARLEAELELAAALRDSAVRALAARAFGLSPRALEALGALVDALREIEGLPAGRATAGQRRRSPAGTRAATTERAD